MLLDFRKHLRCVLLSLEYWRTKQRYSLHPVLVSIPTEDGGVTAQIIDYAAIPKSSANKLKAGQFVKILLSPEMQGNIMTDPDRLPRSAFTLGLPVHQESTRLMFVATEIEEFDALMERVTDAIIYPSVFRKYMNQYMLPYVKKDNTDYDKQLEKIKNALELYKDE